MICVWKLKRLALIFVSVMISVLVPRVHMDHLPAVLFTFSFFLLALISRSRTTLYLPSHHAATYLITITSNPEAAFTIQ